MAICGGCGRYLSSADAIKCEKCCSAYHRACVGITIKGVVQSPWHCPECKKNVVRDNRADTPVRGSIHTDGHETASSNSSLMMPANVDAMDFRRELKLTRDEIMDTLRREFQSLRNDIADIRSMVSACNDRMNSLENRVAAIEHGSDTPQCSSQMIDTIEQLKRDLNEREQDLIMNDVEIAQLPEVTGENVVHTVLAIATKIGVRMEASDIVSAERVGRPGRIDATQATVGPPRAPRPRHLVVRLARRQLRDELLQGARVRRGATTADLELPGPPVRFYINERLTKLNRQLFQAAHEHGRRLGWQFVWSRRGRILARCKPGDSAQAIRSEADLRRVFGSDTGSKE